MTRPLPVPELRGADTFAGERIHSTDGYHGRSLWGRRVAVVGSAAAIAQVLPPVVTQARKVTVFQHDPAWMLPRLPIPAPIVTAVLPDRILHLLARVNLGVQVRDSWMRRQLTPDSATVVRSHSRYYRALQQPNCKLVTWPIATLAPLGIRTVDGIEHRVDCIVFADSDSAPTDPSHRRHHE